MLREIEADSSVGNTLTDVAQSTVPALLMPRRIFWTRPRMMLAAIAAVALVIVALALIAFRNPQTAESSAPINSLAVLPFTNGDPSTVFHYKGRNADPKKT